MKYYTGERPAGTAHVRVVNLGEGDQPLDPRLDLMNHSPDGFDWGYGGSGPAQLALALLADAVGNDAIALRYHLEFKNGFVSRLSGNKWTIPADYVRGWARAMAMVDRRVGQG